MARVFLHVGTMKSGTSYIQRLCNLNQERLADAGLAWPGVQTVNRAVQDLLRLQRAHPDSRGAWQRLARTIRSSPQDSLISMELLGPASPEKIERLGRSLEGQELHLVLTARDVTKVLPSHWQELTQNRGERGWQEYTGEVCGAPGDPGPEGSSFWRHHNVMRVIERWSAIVPTSRTSLVVVPPSGSDRTLLWSRFASVLDAPATGLRMPRRVNPSLGAVSAELMLLLNQQSRDWEWEEYRAGLKGALAKRTLADRRSREPRYGLTADQHLVLREWALTSNAAIARSGINVVGSLDELVPAETPPPVDFTPDEVTDELLLEAALEGLMGLSRKVAQLVAEKEDLEHRLEEGPQKIAPPLTRLLRRGGR